MRKAEIILMIILVLSLAILGLTMEQGGITGAYSINFFEDNLEVIKYTSDKECAGSAVEPCTTQIQFRALKDFKANPAKMIEIDKPEAVHIITQNGMVGFQKEHVYTLKYIVYKYNPAETIYWSWGPII